MPSDRSDHPLPYRILWTWDSWLCDPFDAESYVSEYRRLIDFAAGWGYNGIIIWGFIDARHGGEESAREIARYGNRRGVRILPGVGAGGYGGFALVPGHRFNLDTFLREHPHLRAIPRHSPDAPADDAMCLYRDESLAWLRDGAAWLAANFEIGGVNIETNEAGFIDVCELTSEATRSEPNRLKYAASFTDLGIAVPIIHEEVRRVHPDSWTTYATYEPAWWHRQEDAHLLAGMPEDAIAQWNMELDADSTMPSPVERNISLIHSGGWSYHLAPYPPIWAFTQYRCFYPNLPQSREFCANQHRIGTQGFALGNVGSPDMPDNEIAYIAYAEFSRNPEMTMDEFSERFISQLYGENAEPLVKQLMLEQTAIHEGVKDVWRSWASMMLGTHPSPLPAARESDIEALRGQIDLARRAWERASDEGRKRLDTIIQVLDEYRIIAEVSADPRLSQLLPGLDALDQSGREREIKKLVGILSEAGLPDDIYRYSSLSG